MLLQNFGIEQWFNGRIVDLMNGIELARRICDCLSDGYDDEESREETETALYNELSQISNDSFAKVALLRLCERVEELESD